MMHGYCNGKEVVDTMENIQYCFEGTMKVSCSKCHLNHEYVFDGSDGDSIEQAMEEAMEEAGWSIKRMLCPNCYNPEDDEDVDEEYSTDTFDSLEDFEDMEEDE